MSEGDQTGDEGVGQDHVPPTPKAKPHSRTKARGKDVSEEPEESQHSEGMEELFSEPEPNDGANGVDATPKASRKRPRAHEDTVSNGDDAGEQSSDSQTEAEEFIIRRKRVRR
jgi:hypothetical protein